MQHLCLGCCGHGRENNKLDLGKILIWITKMENKVLCCNVFKCWLLFKLV